ncbi:uncharacterized protein LOC109001065 isoform X2 [Juglans regia]|uniref:Uncharacterized protein LOC109001065 isoform X2 n=2 Tax=Juglans regia TaxID=51240 RepID=A0A6P9E538_JUGRE|nr:uncharacterized protein LOC109001065 isoform X2 [Juglans regia]
MIQSVNMLSLSMARGIMSFPAVLTALFVLLLFHQTCSVKDIHLTEAGNGTCSPSSCGSIQNISYPFRLMEDPPNCGDQRYKLSCENNIAVLYLYGGKYYVREINYSDYTIRVVDSGIQRANFSSIPRYFLTDYNFSYVDPYSYPEGTYYFNKVDSIYYARTISIAFLSCEKQVINSEYSDLNIPTNCSEKGVYSSKYSSSSSQMHRYVAYDLTPLPEEVEESCRLDIISLISLEADGYTEAAHRYKKAAPSCEEIHNELLYGFMLYWFQVYCKCDAGPTDCYLDEYASKIQCWNRTTDQGFFERLEEVYNDVTYGLGKASEAITRGKLPEALYAAVHYHDMWTRPGKSKSTKATAVKMSHVFKLERKSDGWAAASTM